MLLLAPPPSVPMDDHALQLREARVGELRALGDPQLAHAAQAGAGGQHL